jgi:CBS domain containing-hemolysin-like protein
MARRVSFPLRCATLLVGVVVAGLVFAAVVLAADQDASGETVAKLGRSSHFTMMVVYATVALVFSFLCSIAEAVVLSVSLPYIANLKNNGKLKAAAQLNKLKTNIDRSLAAILTLNTIAHTLGAGGAGAEAAAYYGEKYVGVAMAVLTLLILFLSEIIPKTLGALYWRSLAPVTGQFVQLLIWALYPLILVSEVLTRWLARGKSVQQFSRDEFEAMVDVGAEAGQLDATESRILRNLFRFPELRAKDIMTPRTVVFSLPQDATVDQVMDKHETVTFSRIPIYADNRDEVTGFVLKTDLLLNQHEHGGRGRLRDLKRDIGGVHESTPLSKVLDEMLNHRSHILLVIDDYGGVDGIVTLEDVVETLIGIEIVDEADTIEDMRQLARQKWEERMVRVGVDVHGSDKTDSPES